MMKHVVATCPGSCGELCQGIVGNQEYLLSYGIDAYSRVCLNADEKALTFDSRTHSKLQQAKQLFAPDLLADVAMTTQLPIGKGCSSSTADIVAFLKASALLKGQDVSAAYITEQSAMIEPTDSVAFSQWTLINPLTGKCFYQSDWQPDLYVYMLEPLSRLDTLDLVRVSACPAYDKQASEQLYHLLQQALVNRDEVALGRVATESARLNQARLAKPYFDELIAFVEKEQLLGLNVAHSGTVVGLLLDKQDCEKIAELEEKIAKHTFATYYEKRTLHRIVYEGLRAEWNDDEFRNNFSSNSAN